MEIAERRLFLLVVAVGVELLRLDRHGHVPFAVGAEHGPGCINLQLYSVIRSNRSVISP